MTSDDIQEIKDLLNDESCKWRLDAGDLIGYIEELLDEVERLTSNKSEIQCSSCGKWMTDVTSEACAAVARHVLFRTGGKDEAVVVTENGKPKYEIKVIEIGG